MDAVRIAANQQRTFEALWAEVRPHVVADSALPRRLKALLGRNRALGARDRRLYRELLYTAIRFLPWAETARTRDADAAARLIAWLAPDDRDTAAYRARLLPDWPAVPPELTAKAAVLAARLGGPFAPTALLPAWFRDHCPAAFSSPHLDALNERARLWVRLQCRETSVVLDEFLGQRWTVRLEPDVPEALSLPPSAEVAATDAYRRGLVEIQDLGSQLVLHHAPVAPGQSWFDACAGAGGKTLQLARLVGEQGRVDASDIRAGLLQELRERAVRARLANVRVVREPGEAYDGVLVDAPCSGSGTWRRLPHMKWHTLPEMIDRFAAAQRSVLAQYAPRVRPGGLLVYATCSLSRRENHDVAAAFLEAHPDFAPEPPLRAWGGEADGLGHTLLPGARDSDGFYVALLRRR